MLIIQTNLSVLPAHAGVIPHSFASLKDRGSFTRTRGGDPASHAQGGDALAFYPHTRG